MSVDRGIIEHMFEALTDAALIDAVGEATRNESAAVACRFALIGQLDARRAKDLEESIFWRTDPYEEVTAEIAAAENISRGRASNQVHHARVLRDRLPQVAAVFATGVIDERMVAIISSRTENVDDELMPRLDAALASHCVKWMRLSGPQLVTRLDLWVAKFDPAAVRVPPKVDDNRHVFVVPGNAGMAGIWGSIHATDAAAFDQRLDLLAASVCDKDPRSIDQRRADACGALGRGEARLACQCGAEECPVAAERKAVADVVIHVLAEQATLDGTSDQPGYLAGFGVLPAESVRGLATTAQLKPLVIPSGAPDPGYRPSAVTAAFVRWRDLTCRWPGCDAPVERCDIDHTVPYPVGVTHPSNNKLYCRTHHLIKTFYSGPGGWTDQQLPDGTIIFTAPTGHTYTTEPLGAMLFPALKRSTGALDVPPTLDVAETDRALMMPRRKQTREQDRRDRILQERRQRTELIAEEERQRQAWLAANYEPPPF
jgi:hypothetical protein